MAANFRINQHLKMSPNAQIKNLVPENLTEVPPQEEWKEGRIWFNSTIGKIQGVFLKCDKDGIPLEPKEMEVRIIGYETLGVPTDGEFWPDGLFSFNSKTKIPDAMDEVNEALKDLAPAEATLLNGNLTLIVDGGLRTGRIAKNVESSPDQLRMEGISEGDFINNIIVSDSISAQLPNNGFFIKGKQQLQFGKADEGVMTVYFDSIQVDDGVNLGENFNESSRDYEGVYQGFNHPIMQDITNLDGSISTIEVNPNKDAYRSSSGVLTIETVERYNQFKKWQRGVGILNFGKFTGQEKITPGYHTFYVKHDNILNSSFTTNTANVFYDPNKIAPEILITKFAVKSGNIKHVSGIPFYNSNISFSVDLTVTNAFAYTYWDEPINLTALRTDASTIAWNDETSNLNSVDIPNYDDTIEITDYSINYNGVNSVEETVTLFGKAGKVSTSWGETKAKELSILIDTSPLSNNSTWLKETFNDEDFRIPSDTDFDNMSDIESKVGTWDSTALLTNGNAQQYLGKLQKANRNYDDFGIDIDYSEFTGTVQTYFRPFKAENKVNSNGKIKIITSNTIGENNDIEIYIKFPNLTGWLDLSKLYDIQNFANNYTEDGTGCATNIIVENDSITIDWTIGTLSTADSGYGYVIKVIINNETAKISEIEEISPNWR